jgi:hypothetical protein
MNANLTHAILISAAGVVLVAPYLIRWWLWRRANNAVAVYAPGRAAIGITAQQRALAYAHSLAVVNEPYVTRHPAQWTEREWRPLHNAILAPDYEGIAVDDPDDGADWINTVRQAGYSVELAAEPHTPNAERAAALLANRDFERFDRMMTRGMSHVDTICSATMQRWQDEWRQWCDAHPTEATAVELADTRDWIERERGAVTTEFERIMTAEGFDVQHQR